MTPRGEQSISNRSGRARAEDTCRDNHVRNRAQGRQLLSILPAVVPVRSGRLRHDSSPSRSQARSVPKRSVAGPGQRHKTSLLNEGGMAC